MNPSLNRQREIINSVTNQPWVVRDLMTKDLFTLFDNDTFQIVRALMDWRKIRHVPVVNQENQLVGLITNRDLLRLTVSELAEIDRREVEQIYSTIKVSDIMQKNITSVEPNVTLNHAARIMLENKFGCLPVVEGGQLVGIITEADFVKAFVGK